MNLFGLFVKIETLSIKCSIFPVTLVDIAVCFDKSAFTLKNTVLAQALIKSAILKFYFSKSFKSFSILEPDKEINKKYFKLTIDHDINCNP